jgi:hypothetical protein
MSYPGYQQQGGYYPQQPQEDPFARQGSPLLARFSAVVGLGVAGTLVWQTMDLLSLLGDATADMPVGWTAMIVAHFVIAGLALIGAVLVFARRVAGAFLLLTSAVLAIAAMLTAPLVAEDVGLSMVSSVADYAAITSSNELYFHQLFEFEFDNTQATLRFVPLALGVLLLIVAVLPPSLNWLRRPRRNAHGAQQTGW